MHVIHSINKHTRMIFVRPSVSVFFKEINVSSLSVLKFREKKEKKKETLKLYDVYISGTDG